MPITAVPVTGGGSKGSQFTSNMKDVSHWHNGLLWNQMLSQSVKILTVVLQVTVIV